MNESKKINAAIEKTVNINRTISIAFIAACVVWTGVLLFSFIWNHSEYQADLKRLVHEAARESLEKDIQYRLWNSNHGGVYVPVTEKTRPNPYLSHIKDRDITTPSGKKLTLVNPAYMSRQVFEQERDGHQIPGHITSLKPIQPDNKPDEWEAGAISILVKGKKEFGEIVVMNGAPQYRLILPLFLKKSCLNCHGAQGYKAGDVYGGISTAVPMEPYQVVVRSHERIVFSAHAVVWMFGILGLTLSGQTIKRRIAERAVAEESLRESEARYRTIIEHSNDMIWILDIEGNFLFFNQRCEELTGYKLADWRGKSFAPLIKEEELPRIVELFGKTLLGQPRQYEVSLPCQDGRTIFLLVNSTPLYSKEGISGTASFGKDITDRVLAEKSLQESEARFRTLFEGAPDAIFLADPQSGLLLDANPAAAKLMQRPREELIGLHQTQLHPSKSGQVAGERFAKHARQEYREPIETEVLRKDGNRVPVHINAQLITINGKKVLQGVFRDITKLKGVEYALQESETRFRELANALPQPVFEVDMQGIILFTNQRGYELFGYTPDEVSRGIDVFSMVVAEDRERARQNVARLLADGRMFDIEYTARRKDGSTFPVIIYTSTIVRNGIVAGFRGIVVDYTERKSAIDMMHAIAEQVSVKTGDDFFRTVTEYISHELGMDFAFVGEVQEGERQISTIDFYGQGMHHDAYTYALEGTPCEGITENAPCIYPSEAGRIFPKCAMINTYGIESFIGVPLRNKSGQLIGIIAAMSVSALVKETVERGIAMFRILGTRAEAELERKRQEMARRELEDKLLQSRKMESVGLLAGGVAHDINNMLTPILGYTELLGKRIAPDDPIRAPLGEISSAAEWIKKLVQQLLAFASRQTLEMTFLDVNAVIDRFVKMLHFTIRENIQVELRLNSAQGSVVGDAGRIEQIILNLAVNAQDAMPEGGVLLIETMDVLLDDTSARCHEDIAPGRFTVIAVSDTGSGMDKSTQSRIFDPFFTTKGRGKGVGLGLATVYGIVRQHGGCVEVISEKGKGAMFRIYLPHACQLSEKTENTAMISRIQCGNETILVVEDEERVLGVIKELLFCHGYQVLAASDGKKALELAMSHQGELHLLITDVIMPGVNGKVLFEQLAYAGKCMNVLYMSAYPEDVISKHGVLDPEVHFVRKPFVIQEFMDKVREALETKRQRAGRVGESEVAKPDVFVQDTR